MAHEAFNTVGTLSLNFERLIWNIGEMDTAATNPSPFDTSEMDRGDSFSVWRERLNDWMTAIEALELATPTYYQFPPGSTWELNARNFEDWFIWVYANALP